MKKFLTILLLLCSCIDEKAEYIVSQKVYEAYNEKLKYVFDDDYDSVCVGTGDNRICTSYYDYTERVKYLIKDYDDYILVLYREEQYKPLFSKELKTRYFREKIYVPKDTYDLYNVKDTLIPMELKSYLTGDGNNETVQLERIEFDRDSQRYYFDVEDDAIVVRY